MAHAFLVALVAALVLASAVAARAGEGPGGRAGDRVRFRPVDVMVESAGKRLAAYQVAVRYDSSRVKIVGIEGGGEAGFTDAPFYDRAGMEAGRIVIAAFVADDAESRAGRTRVARLHLMVKGDVTADALEQLTIEPVTAARPGGERIEIWPELVRLVTEPAPGGDDVREGKADE